MLEVLEQWRRFANADGAAVYAPCDGGGFERVVGVGSDDLPLRLDQKPDTVTGLRELPGGMLLMLAGGTPGTVEAPSPAVDFVLSAGSHLRQLRDRLKERSFQDNLKVVKLEALYDVGLAIASTLNLDQLSEEILGHAVALLDARRGALYLLENGTYRVRRAIGGSALETLAEGEEPLHERATDAQLLPGVKHLLVVPIAIDGSKLGILAVADKESRTGVGPFSEDDQRSLSLFANQAAIALENANLHRQALEKERLERDMELAAEIQRGLLPSSIPEVEGLEILGWNRPTRQVGGDYYGYYRLSEDRIGMVVADVTGKGMPAALLVSTLHSALRLLLDRVQDGAELLSRLNQHILEASGTNKFITLILAVVDSGENRLGFFNAGHNPGLIVRRDGQVDQLLASGLPLGLMPGATYTYESVPFAPGDLLCLYSDGITECAAANDDEYGMERFCEYLREQREAPLPDILSGLDREMADFAGDHPQSDDQTVVLVRRV